MSVLLIAPQDQQAWLVGPDHEAARDGVPLCASHADRVTVPFGWQLRDDRPVAKPRARRRSRSRKARPEPLPETEPVVESAPVGETDTAPPAPTRRSAAPKAAAKPARVRPEPARPASGAEPAPAASAPDASVEADQPASLGVEPGPPASADVEPALDTAATDPATDPAPARTDAADPADPADAPSGGIAPAEVVAVVEASKPDRSHAPADVPVHADDVAAAFAGSGARLTVVPGDDDPSKTFTVEPDGQTALWAESQRDDHEPSDETPLLKRAFRVVRED